MAGPSLERLRENFGPDRSINEHYRSLSGDETKPRFG